MHTPPRQHTLLLLLPRQLELLQHVGVDLLLQAVGPLVQLAHEPELALQLQRHIRYACRAGWEVRQGWERAGQAGRGSRWRGGPAVPAAASLSM